MFDGQAKEIEIYESPTGACPFNDWVDSLRDKPTREYIINWLFKLRAGNSCDFAAVGEGVLELRDKRRGPGYRLYVAFAERHLLLLLGGGNKRTQQQDIEQAKAAWREYQQRKKKS
jgi:putative addiction module killer protein